MNPLHRFTPDWRQFGATQWAAVTAIVVLALTVTGFAVTRDDQLPDGAALKVDDRVVSADQLQSRVDTLKALYGVEVPTDAKERDNFDRDAAKSYALQVLIEGAAKDKDIEIADKAVADALNVLIKQRYPDGGRDAFIDALGSMGASEEQVLAEIKQQMVVARLFDDVTRGISVSDADLRKAFDERRKSLATPERRQLRNIVVKKKADAQQVVRALAAGEDFAVLARAVSLDQSTKGKGGELGLVAADQLESAYAKAAFGAEPGAAFGPIKSEHGWNVGLVEQVRKPVPARFAKVKDGLRQTLQNEMAMEAWRGWLQDLLGDHTVEYADDYRPDDPDSVPDLLGAETQQ
ncbi:hypothetical protein ASG90_06945 [Nocardioides sp. Soil797]|nr:hypothetical protein ASG90_06945 [Nocardioides sp. Soil797]